MNSGISCVRNPCVYNWQCKLCQFQRTYEVKADSTLCALPLSMRTLFLLITWRLYTGCSNKGSQTAWTPSLAIRHILEIYGSDPQSSPAVTRKRLDPLTLSVRRDAVSSVHSKFPQATPIQPAAARHRVAIACGHCCVFALTSTQATCVFESGTHNFRP